MSYVTSDEPYIAVPGLIAQADFESIAASFATLSEVQVVRTDHVPVYQAAPVDPASANAIGYWIVNFGPEFMRQLAFWGLASYAGKKIVDGFLSEAGKDLWKGVRTLCKFIFHKLAQHQTDKSPTALRIVDLRGVGRPREAGPYFSVSIVFSIPSTEAQLQMYINDVESVIYPLIGCLAGQCDVVRLHVDRENYHGWPWRVHRLIDGGIFLINPKKRTFKQLETRVDDQLTQECLRTILHQSPGA